MRSVLAAAIVVVLGCAGQRPMPERAASLARPEPDPACRTIVADSMRLTGVERITVRVAVVERKVAVNFVSPDLTPAQRDDIRRAFAECVWRPDENGAAAGTIVFTLPR
jgi:hypothetical protein